MQPQPKRVELVEMVYNIANKVPENEKEACIAEGIASIKKLKEKRRRTDLNSTVKFLKENDVKLLISDKTGSFRDATETPLRDKSRRSHEQEP